MRDSQYWVSDHIKNAKLWILVLLLVLEFTHFPSHICLFRFTFNKPSVNILYKVSQSGCIEQSLFKLSEAFTCLFIKKKLEGLSPQVDPVNSFCANSWNLLSVPVHLWNYSVFKAFTKQNVWNKVAYAQNFNRNCLSFKGGDFLASKLLIVLVVLMRREA